MPYEYTLDDFLSDVSLIPVWVALGVGLVIMAPFAAVEWLETLGK